MITAANATAQATARDCVRFIHAKEFLAELGADVASKHVLDGIVRLVIYEDRATLGMVESDRTPGNDRHVPYEVARAHFVECAYTSTRGQLVKLSQWIGVTWTNPGEAGDRREHNEEIRKASSKAVQFLQAALSRLPVEVRGGGLFLDDGGWSAYPDQVIETPEALSCRWCAQPVYYANNAWRHVASRQAAEMREAPCDRCGGLGSLRSEAGRYRLCPTCQGAKVMKVTDHVADVEELEEAPA